MANTYNAQLAKNVGQAQGTPFVDIAGAFSKTFDARVDEATKANREADDKRSEWNAEVVNFDVDVNGDSPEVAAAKMEEAAKFRAGYLKVINTGDPFDPNKRKVLEEYKNKINQLKQSGVYLEAIKKDNVVNAENISPANDAKAYEQMQQLLKSKPVWDEKTQKYGFKVGDEIKTRAQLENDILDIIETPVVGMTNINDTFAKGTGIQKTVDPNNPTKYGYSWTHAKPFLEAEVREQLNDKAYGKDLRYHTLSQGDGMYVKNHRYANKTKSEIDAEAESELRGSGELGINDKDPQIVAKKVKEHLEKEVVDAYLNGFKEQNKNSIIEPKPEKQTTYKETALEEEIKKTRPFVNEVTNFVKRINPADKKEAKYKGDEKVKQIINKINSLNPESPTGLLTRGEAFKKYVESENERLKSLDADEREKELKGKSWLSSEEMKQNFLEVIGENEKNKGLNQIFEFDEFNNGTFEFKPAPINTRDSKSILNFMLDRIEMTDKAENSFKSELVAKNFK